MTLSEAIAEVKSGRMRTPGPCARTILNAVASGDLIPRTDAEQAVALAYQRAASVASNACLVDPDGGNPTEDERLVCEDAYRRILALAPADALAEVQALRTERDELINANDDLVWLNADKNRAERDAAEWQRRAEAAEAEAARLNAALDEAYALGFEASSEGWNGEYAPFEVREDPDWQERRRQTLAALKGNAP